MCPSVRGTLLRFYRPFTLAALKSAIFFCYKKDGTFDL